jgi:hypothetical protein
MSELIEQLAKEHGEKLRIFGCTKPIYQFTAEMLEAFAKAYQAAAPIDNIAGNFDYIISYLEECVAEGQTNLQGLINDVTNFRALIPDTQAKEGE